MILHCCHTMQAQVNFTCPDHPELADCPDALIFYSDRFREYGLRVHDGGSGAVEISFCPWCGTRLPGSLRARWFDELAALGHDDPLSDEIPADFRTGAWYRAGAAGQEAADGGP